MNSKNNSSNEVELTKKLIQKREEVKRKLELLRQSEIIQEKAFFPITKRLETISDQLHTNKKNEFNRKLQKNNNFMAESTPMSPFNEKKSDSILNTKVSNLRKKIQALKNDKIIEAEDQNEFHNNTESTSNLNEEGKQNENVLISEPTDVASDYDLDDLIEHSVEESKRNIQEILDTNVYDEYLATFDELPRKYIDAMIHDKKRHFDHRTGIRHDSFQEKFYIGTSVVEFIGSDVKVDERFYKATPGLYELLFKNAPSTYTQEDLYAYKEILDISNACRSNFDPNGRILGTRSDKYKSIIGPLYFDQPNYFETPKRLKKTLGKGLFKEVNNHHVDYIYWDDINELVDRLRLLVASQTAGHTSHTNEIVSILEELREAKVIY